MKRYRVTRDLFGNLAVEDVTGEGCGLALLVLLVAVIATLPLSGLIVILWRGWSKTPAWFRALWVFSVVAAVSIWGASEVIQTRDAQAREELAAATASALEDRAASFRARQSNGTLVQLADVRTGVMGDCGMIKVYFELIVNWDRRFDGWVTWYGGGPHGGKPVESISATERLDWGAYTGSNIRCPSGGFLKHDPVPERFCISGDFDYEPLVPSSELSVEVCADVPRDVLRCRQDGREVVCDGGKVGRLP